MKVKILSLLFAGMALTTSCEDFLDRPPMDTITDTPDFWENEENYRTMMWAFYDIYFDGYKSSWTRTNWFAETEVADWVDDNAQKSPTHFIKSVPSSDGDWSFTYVRRYNQLIDRATNSNLPEEAKNHWLGVARFFRAMEYASLVADFGDVPWFDTVIENTDLENLYKPRTPRAEVMDNVLADLQFACQNIRTSDGVAGLHVNKAVALAYTSRIMLFEGTWQKYHGGDQAASQKYLQLAKDAAEIVMNSGKYAIETPLRELFGSQDLKGNKEALMYRHYTAEMLKHHVASYSNGQESQSPAPNLALIKSFICQDGKVYQKSDLANVTPMTIENLMLTRDPRFEATFVDKAKVQSNTLLYACKFIDRNALTLANPGTVAMYGSNTNTNDAPVIRYAEVLLNWIEAKAELGAVTQDDLDKSVNQLRRRPLDATAEAKGIKNTPDMVLADITADFDPARDADVSPILWEIRRERRMEFVYEYSRLQDLRRWKKLDYMSNYSETGMPYTDNMLGPWVDLAKEVPSYVEEGQIGKRAVMKEDGTVVTFDGTNAADMVGYYIPQNAQPRDVFTDRNYLAPVGEQQINEYKMKGFNLSQTKGW